MSTAKVLRTSSDYTIGDYERFCEHRETFRKRDRALDNIVNMLITFTTVSKSKFNRQSAKKKNRPPTLNLNETCFATPKRFSIQDFPPNFVQQPLITVFPEHFKRQPAAADTEWKLTEEKNCSRIKVFHQHRAHIHI